MKTRPVPFTASSPDSSGRIDGSSPIVILRSPDSIGTTKDLGRGLIPDSFVVSPPVLSEVEGSNHRPGLLPLSSLRVPQCSL